MSLFVRISRSAFQRLLSPVASAGKPDISLSRILATRPIMTTTPVNKDKSDFDPRTLTNTDWEKRLTEEEFYVTREKGTERPYTGEYTNHFEDGLYKCVCCGAELFTSTSKFDSGCGWPAFSEAKGAQGKDESETNVLRRPDNSFGMTRTEVMCKKCDAHLGHVFEDGPQPTGERFCINSVSLRFKKK